MKITLFVIMLSWVAWPANGQKEKVVFVCEHGAAKSVIAAGYFNKMASERGLNYEAISRATAPDSSLNPATRAGLKADKIAQNKKPQMLTATDAAKAKRIIIFTPVPDNFNTDTPIEDWSSTQNIDGSYQQRRDAIIKRVNALLDSLENQQDDQAGYRNPKG